MIMQNLKPVQQAALKQLESFAKGRSFDPLEQFCADFLTQAPVIGYVPFAGAVSMIENITSILLYRREQFQVQMFAVPEATIIPEHSHPNVDTIVVYVGGNIHFSHSGKYSYGKETLHEMQGSRGLPSKRGVLIRVPPNVLHGAVVGEGGGVFYSVERWINGVEPHCVASDYNGVALGENHFKKVVCGDVSVKATLTPKDAASLEH